MKLLFLTVALCIAFTVPLRAAPPIGAIVQTWHYDPQTNSVTLEIVNISHKDISGYGLSISATYADGHVDNFQHFADFVATLKFLRDIQGTPDEDRIRKEWGNRLGLFHPGEVRKQSIGVEPGLKDFHAELDVVAYGDQTIEATNEAGLQQLTNQRKVDLASTKLANGIIKAALADPNDPDPAATAVAKLQDKITVWNSQTHTSLDLDPGMLQGVVNDLKQLPSDNKREALTEYLMKSERGVTMLSPHADLKKTEVPQ